MGNKGSRVVRSVSILLLLVLLPPPEIISEEFFHLFQLIISLLLIFYYAALTNWVILFWSFNNRKKLIEIINNRRMITHMCLMTFLISIRSLDFFWTFFSGIPLFTLLHRSAEDKWPLRVYHLHL